MRTMFSSLAVGLIGLVLVGCQTAPVSRASDGMSAGTPGAKAPVAMVATDDLLTDSGASGTGAED